MFRWWRACSTTPGELSTTDPAPRTDMHRHHHRPTATVPSRILSASLQTTHAQQNSRVSQRTGYRVPQCGRTRLSARLGSAHSCYLAWVSQFKLTGKMPNSLSDLADGSAILEVQHNPDSMQHATSNMQPAADNMQHMPQHHENVQYATRSMQAFNIRRGTCRVQRAADTIQHTPCTLPTARQSSRGGRRYSRGTLLLTVLLARAECARLSHTATHALL
jgi:hypothetical protein